MNIVRTSLAVSLAAMLAACGGGNVKPEPEAVAECIFPGTTTAAPGWICDEPVPGVEISAVGVSEPSRAGISFMRDRASADARGRLAEQVQVTAQKMVKSYLGTTGVGNDETVDAAASSTLRTVANQELHGSKIYRSLQAPDGRYYVLMGIDRANAEKIVEQSVRTSMRNDQAMWQQFQAQKSFDEMAAEIARQPMQ